MTLATLLEKVPIWTGRDPVATPLSGGITNQNFRVEVGGDSYVLRLLSTTTDHLGIDRDNEAACTRIAADLGVGPELVHYSLDDAILVVRFVEAETLSAESAREPARMARIVNQIKRYQGGPEFPGLFCPFDTVRSYHQRAAERRVEFPASLDRALEHLQRIEAVVERVRTIVPCHNDLLAANFLDDGEKIWIIDWEYGGMGDPFFDLGNFAVNQELDDDGTASLLEEYRGEVRTADLAHLKLMALASDLREAFWGFLQSGVSELDFDYTAYGEKHLDRFLARAATPALEACLREVAG